MSKTKLDKWRQTVDERLNFLEGRSLHNKDTRILNAKLPIPDEKTMPAARFNVDTSKGKMLLEEALKDAVLTEELHGKTKKLTRWQELVRDHGPKKAKELYKK